VKKPPPTFEALCKRPGLYPEQVSAYHLSEILSALSRLVAGAAGTNDLARTGAKIGLLNIRRGSAGYQFSAPAPPLALENLRETGRILEEPEEIGDRDYMLSPLQDLSAIARLLQCP